MDCPCSSVQKDNIFRLGRGKDLATRRAPNTEVIDWDNWMGLRMGGGRGTLGNKFSTLFNAFHGRGR